MTIPEFIEKAIAGGWPVGSHYEFADGTRYDQSGIFLDPLAWKAVGEVENWGARSFKPATWEAMQEDTKTFANEGAALYRFSHLPQALWHGGSIESYLETL